jgi:hypothetical protein
VSLFSAAPALAQQATCAPRADGQPSSNAELFKELLDATGAGQMQILPDRGLIRLVELVELPVPCQPGARISADVVEVFYERGVLEASGNVVFVDAEGRIAAERVVFDLEAGTGTFYWASGLMTLGAGANRAEFGNQDPDVFFHGETIEKLGSERYRITRGGFTTCVQPEPRWEIVSKSVVINLKDYALARNMVLRVKGGRPRDRLPDADLRRVHVAGRVDQQRILLGHQPQPGRDRVPRLVRARRSGCRSRVPVRVAQGIGRGPLLPVRPARA